MLIECNNIKYEVDDKWSFKNFMNQYSPCDQIPDGIIIYSTQFYHEQLDSSPFRSTMIGVTFIKCNLDNVIIPPGNMVIDCSQKRFCCQNDGHDWEVDLDNKPIWLLCGNKIFDKFGLEYPTPAEIPMERVHWPIDWLEQKRLKLFLSNIYGDVV